MDKKTVLMKIILDIDMDKTDINELEGWMAEQLQGMQNCDEGILGYFIKETFGKDVIR